MPKKPRKSSTASSPSWRTLMRRATAIEKAGKPRAAAALRKQAAELRHGRPQRTRRSDVNAAQAAVNQVRGNALGGIAGATTASFTGGGAPAVDQALNEAMFGEQIKPTLIGVVDTDAEIADIIAAARRDGAQEVILNRLLALQGVAKYEGQKQADDQATKRLIEVQKRTDERIVCGFIAEVEAAIQLHRGLPTDQVWSLNSLLVVKITDALNRAGYSAKGYDNFARVRENREALMGKAHADVNRS
jgi:uncharacterized protein YdbL (DUF1318 family)